MAYADWTRATSQNGAWQLQAASPIDGVSHLEFILSATAGSPRAVGVTKPNSGSSVTSWHVRSVMKYFSGSISSSSVSWGMFGSMQSAFSATTTAYWLGFSTGGQVKVFKGTVGDQSGSTQIGTTMNLGSDMSDGSARAFGLKCLYDSGSGTAFLYPYWSNGTVGSGYNYSGMVLIAGPFSDSSGYNTSQGCGLYGVAQSGITVGSCRLGFDETEIYVP